MLSMHPQSTPSMHTARASAHEPGRHRDKLGCDCVSRKNMASRWTAFKCARLFEAQEFLATRLNDFQNEPRRVGRIGGSIFHESEFLTCVSLFHRRFGGDKRAHPCLRGRPMAGRYRLTTSDPFLSFF